MLKMAPLLHAGPTAPKRENVHEREGVGGWKLLTAFGRRDAPPRAGGRWPASAPLNARTSMNGGGRVEIPNS